MRGRAKGHGVGGAEKAIDLGEIVAPPRSRDSSPAYAYKHVSKALSFIQNLLAVEVLPWLGSRGI